MNEINTNKTQRRSLFLWISASLLIILAITVLIGWMTKTPIFIRFNSHLPIMHVNVALCYLFSGISLLSLSFSRRFLAALTGLVVFAIAGTTLIEYGLSLDLYIDQLFYFTIEGPSTNFPGRMAPNTALCLLLSGINLILCSLQYRFITNIVIKISSAFCISIATVALFGYVTGMSLVAGWSEFVVMTLQSAIAIIVLSSAIFHYQYKLGKRENRKSHTTLLIAIFLSLTGTAIFWQIFSAQQYLVIDKFAQKNADRITNDLQEELEDYSREFKLMAHHLKTNNGYNKNFWKIDAQDYLDGYAYITGISWYNSHLELQETQFRSVSYDKDQVNSAILELLNNIKLKNISDTVIHVINKQVIVLLTPLPPSDGQFSGIIVTQMDLPTLIESVIKYELINKEYFELYNPTDLIYSSGTIDSTTLGKGATTHINFATLDWKIKIYPTHDSLTLIRSNLPTLVLILDIAVLTFIALVMFFFETVVWSKKQVEIALNEKSVALAMRQAVFDASNYSIITATPTGLITSFNKAAERMLLYRADELVDKATPDIFHDKEEVIARAKELSKQLGITIAPGYDVFISLAKQGIPDEREWTYVRKDGTRFPVKLSITAIKDTKGNIIGYVGIAYDITELKKIERMKNDLISITSHELRSPLTAIKGSLDILSTHKESDADIKIIEMGRNACDRLIRLTNDILDIQKMDAGKLEYKFVDFPLKNLISKTIEINQFAANNSKVKLEQPKDIPNCTIHGDEDRLIQVLTNFITNAIKYSPEGATVSFVISQQNDRVRIGVRDQGPGIPAEYHNILFHKFAQVPLTYPTAKKGTGLGLSIAKSIVEKHGGTVGFDSSPKGSTFWCELPI